MCDCYKGKQEKSIPFRRTMKIDGTKWEYPIPKSKKYWEEFCDNEKKKFVVVRNPSTQLSYNPFSKTETESVNCNVHCKHKTFNINSSYNHGIDKSKVYKNSLHKTSLLPSKINVSKEMNSFPKSILKLPPATSSKSSISTGNYDTPTKVTRFSKLKASNSLPSFEEIFPKKLDNVSNSINRLPNSSLNFPKLNIPSKKSTSRVEKSEKSLLKRLDSTLAKLQQTNFSKEMPSVSFMVDREEENIPKKPTSEESLKHSIRRAYKALKHVRGNKELNRELKYMKPLSKESASKSCNDFSSDDDSLQLLKKKSIGEYKGGGERSMHFSDEEKKAEEKSLKDSQFTDTDSERETLKLEEAMSKTIPSGSRSTSGSSPEFVYPDTWETPSSSILSSIPKLSWFPRKNRDKCLSCIYKSFESPSERKISFPLTVLQKTVTSQETRILSSSSLSQDSNSTSFSVPTVEKAMEQVSDYITEPESLSFDDESCTFAKEIDTESRLIAEEKIVEITKRESVPDSGASDEAITKIDKKDHPEGDFTSETRNLNEATSSTRNSFEQSKVSFSVHSGSSEENDSLAVSISDDQSKQKYLAPCHAPTIFKPSMEPLKALRNRKATTLQDRIDFNESSSLRKSGSSEDYLDVKEKPSFASKGVFNKNKAGNEKEGNLRSSRVLTRTKSVSEKLTLENMELCSEKATRVLRKGTTLSSFATPGDTESNKSKISLDASKNALRKLNSTEDNGLSKIMPVTNFPTLEMKLPLTRTNEILKILLNLKQDTPPTEMLDTLCKEFLDALSKEDNLRSNKNSKISTRLMKLLVDSKRYLYPDKFPSDLLFSSNQPPPCNPRLLRRILPQKSYNRVAPLLGLPNWNPKKQVSIDDAQAKDQRKASDETIISDNLSVASLLVHPPTRRHVESLVDKENMGQRRYNPYALFLMKPRREVVTWRPLTKRDLEGYDPDATLEMRADNIMKSICQDFCQWLETLGGTSKTIDENVLRDMFEINFNAEICRAMQVSIQEMPVVATEVALTRNSPGASKLAMTRKHVMKDAKAEQRPAKTKAFGASIPWKFRFVPPNNQVQRKWLQCENVPRDLETMEVVWKDITHLKSVRGFVEWLKEHPEVPPPEALKTIVSMDIADLKQIEDDDAFAHLELDISQIRSLRVKDSVDVIPS